MDITDIKVGDGKLATKGMKVGVEYIGKLQNGKIFDQSNNQQFKFTLGSGEVIKGWDIGIVGMKVGGVRNLVIPPHLAYGNKTLPGIPKDSTLIFTVTLRKC